MVRLRELPRTATFAWAPGSGKPLLVTGTRAGAVSADFSDESKLELWDLSLDDTEQGLELQPVVSISTESKFYAIAWGPPHGDHPRGIIAGALENGSLELWDAEKLGSGEDASISQTTKHSGSIKTLQFNPLKPTVLATAGASGEVFVYDVSDIENPFRLVNAARSDDIECLAWNRKVSHILATGSAGGLVTVWDLKTKKATMTLNNNRKAVSAIAWDPENSTRLLTATPDDNTPLILLWNLRNSNAPEKTLQGHEQGVLSLSWCTQDSSILLSSGKDNKNIVWNPQTGERLGEFPEMTNWAFLTAFHPHNPSLSATASFDGKIAVQTLQNTNPDTSKTAAEKNLDDEDFFNAAQTQPQGASWTMPQAPKWLERPIGASFAFGGKVVIFKTVPTQPGQKRASKMVIAPFSVDSEVSSASEKFQAAMASGDVSTICEQKVEDARTDEEKADWQVMGSLVGDSPRQKIIEYLGLKQEDDAVNGEKAETSEETEGVATESNGDAVSKPAADKDDFFGGEGEAEEDDFLAGIAASKGAKTDNPFHLFSDSDTTVEKSVTQALLLGNFAKATTICLKEDRFADAFLIANCGGQELVDKVQAAYLAHKSGVPSYMRLLSSVIGKNLWDVVYNADLESWKETMAVICTFSSPEEFPDLCEALGDRINDEGLRKDASFCYLVGSKLEKAVSIWATELKEEEQAGIKQSSENSTFSVHAKSLQNFIEKVTVFRHVTKFQDGEKDLTSDWKLSTLYDKYTEYADILASHGQLEVAQKYLDLLPVTYPAAEIARNRVKLATRKPAQPTARQPAASSRAPSRVQPGLGYQPPQPAATIPTPNQFAGLGQTPNTLPQPSFAAPSANPYQPQGYQPPGQVGYQPPGQVGYQPPGQPGYNLTPAPPPIGGPPRTQSPAVAPPPQAKDVGDWNDVPFVTKAPPPRRSTPRVSAMTSPFPGQQSVPPPPPSAGPFGQGAGTTPPPPPKSGGPPRMQSPLTGPPQNLQGPPRPTSSAANQYAPPPPQPGAVPSPMPNLVARTASPYNAPPAGAPPSNRYTPAPAPQQPPTQQMAPPPANRAPNPYGAPPSQQPTPSNQYAPSPYAPVPGQTSAPPPASRPPMGGPPMGGPPRSGPPPSTGAAATPPPPRAAAAPAPPAAPAARHPPGDRSHIPANAQGLVEILGQDMQRVASKAPATFAPQVQDTQKRLNILFDHLNNGELVQPGTIEQLSQLAQAIQSKDYTTAQRLQVEIQSTKTEECGNWMVGVKRLISMSKNTP